MKLEIINGIRRLTAAEGKYLTRGGATGTEVWLSPTDTVDGWAEVDTPPDAAGPGDPEVEQAIRDLEGSA